MALVTKRDVPATADTVVPQSADDLLSQESREFIGIGGPDGSGKSCALVSLAWWLEQTQPDVRVSVLDTEKKFKAALKSFGKDCPKNILYYPIDNMNQATSTLATVLDGHNPGDWVFVESLDRVWEKAQNLGYQNIEGVSKAEYLERKRADKSIKSPIPRPDDFWAIVKGAHDGAFIDLLTDAHLSSLNVICTTTVAKPKQDRSDRKESADRKMARIELGIDANLNGAPRLPYYFETLCLFGLQAGTVTCRVLRDNLSTRGADSRTEFTVTDYKSWGMEFFAQCRS